MQGFRRNPVTGQLTFIGAFAAGQTPTSIAFKGGPATNNAPIVRISPPDQSWVSAGQTVALSGAGSNDPDASHCIANPSNYVYAWTQVSGPPVAITNPASLSLASVTLNTAGAYTFQLQFTDDAGNCPGPAQTGTRTIVIHAGVQHTQAVPDSCSGPGAAPFPTAKFTAASTRQQQLGIMTGWWIAVRPAPTPFGWGWVSVPACQSDELEYNAAYAQCVSRAAQSVPFLPLWSQTQTQTCVAGTWRWWDYN